MPCPSSQTKASSSHRHRDCLARGGWTTRMLGSAEGQQAMWQCDELEHLSTAQGRHCRIDKVRSRAMWGRDGRLGICSSKHFCCTSHRTELHTPVVRNRPSLAEMGRVRNDPGGFEHLWPNSSRALPNAAKFSRVRPAETTTSDRSFRGGLSSMLGAMSEIGIEFFIAAPAALLGVFSEHAVPESSESEVE